MDTIKDIRAFLKQVRNELNWCFAVKGIAIWLTLCVALGGGAMIIVWLNDGHQLHLTRELLVGATVLVTIWLLIQHLWLPYRRFRTDEDVARYVEQRSPGLNNAVISSIQLRDTIETEKSTPVTTGLVMALAKRTAQQLDHLRPAHLAPWKKTRRSLHYFALILCALGGAAMLFPVPFQTGGNALLFGLPEAQATEAKETTVQRDIVVRDTTYTLLYPAYTELPSQTIANSTGDLRVLTGTRVRLETSSLIPTTEANLIFTREDVSNLPLRVTAGNHLSGEFTVLENNQFRFQLITPSNQTVEERIERSIEAIPDNGPHVELLHPQDDLVARMDESITLRYSANDDYGLSAIDLVVQGSEASSMPVRRRVATPSRVKSFAGEAVVTMSVLGLQPGEHVLCWVEAYDNNTVAESPQQSRSKTIRIKLHDDIERHHAVIDAQRHLVETMIDLLADRLESEIHTKAQSRYVQLHRAQSQLIAKTESMLGEFQALLQTIDNDPLMNNPIRTDLQELFKRHRDNYEGESHQLKIALSATVQQDRIKRLTTLDRYNETTIVLLEDDIMLMERLLEKQHQNQVVNEARDLVTAHRTLHQLLEAWKNARGPEARLKVQQQISALLKQVQRLMSNLRKNAKPVPYTNMNLSAVESTGEMNDLQTVQTTLQQMQELIKAGKLDEAMALSDDIGTNLQTLTSALETELKNLQMASNPQSMAQMRRLASRLNSVAHSQSAVHLDTHKIQQSYQKKLSALVRKELVPQIAEELQRLTRLSNQLNRVSSDDLHRSDQKQLHELKRNVADLRETLSEEDLSQALRMSRHIRKDLGELAHETRFRLDRLTDPVRKTAQFRRLQRNLNHMNKARPIARKVLRHLEDMLPGVDELLDRREKRRLDRLHGRQSKVVVKLDRLEDLVEQLESVHPGVGRRLKEQLREARLDMNQAERRLQEHRPGSAKLHAQDALEKIETARNQLKQARSKPSGKTGVGGLSDRRRIAIPDADHYQVPKEFRDELLKAIKERAPKRYQTLIDRYYEVLVK